MPLRSTPFRRTPAYSCRSKLARRSLFSRQIHWSPILETLEVRSLPSGLTGTINPAVASVIALDPSGAGAQSGDLQYAGQQDVYRIIAPVTGTLAIYESPLSDHDLPEVEITVDDASGNPVSTGAQGVGIFNQIEVPVRSGGTYYIVVGEAAPPPEPLGGGYSLSFYMVAHSPSDTIATAQPITLAPDGSGQQSGTIDTPGGRELFRVLAPVSGLLSVEQVDPPGTLFDCSTLAYDASGDFLDEDSMPVGFVAGDFNLVQLQAVAGATYFIEVAALGASTGQFHLFFGMPSNTGTDTDPIPLSAAGFAQVSGTIVLPYNDTDSFTYIPGATGLTTVQLAAAPGSQFVGSLDVVDSSNKTNTTLYPPPIANTAYTPGLAQFMGIAGHAYDILVSSNPYAPVAPGTDSSSSPFVPGDIGSFVLTVGPDDYGGTFESATPLVVDSSGAESIDGAIQFNGDVDMFRFVAPLTGRTRIDLQNHPAAHLMAW